MTVGRGGKKERGASGDSFVSLAENGIMLHVSAS